MIDLHGRQSYIYSGDNDSCMERNFPPSLLDMAKSAWKVPQKRNGAVYSLCLCGWCGKKEIIVSESIQLH